MYFEHPPDNRLSEKTEQHIAGFLGVSISLVLYAVIGYCARSVLQWTYLNAESVYDTWLSRAVQDILLGILTLMVIGVIFSVLYIIAVLIRDAVPRTRPRPSLRLVHG